jgi:hypothetical protein
LEPERAAYILTTRKVLLYRRALEDGEEPARGIPSPRGAGTPPVF